MTHKKKNLDQPVKKGRRKEMADKIRQLQKELGTIIKGKKEVTDKIIMAVLARGHVLLEDVPGVGKTTTALEMCIRDRA